MKTTAVDEARCGSEDSGGEFGEFRCPWYEEKSNEENGTTNYKRKEESVRKENGSVLVRKANDNLIK
ncbi:unnamed protein product [Brassica oleracea]|uniref:(rape) hypothetical protein n=1 Tax=Brassica napus TaxID=3708 RepID=A0A816MJ13_BRANA|nr:unnamed protein product [Brassica napus]